MVIRPAPPPRAPRPAARPVDTALLADLRAALRDARRSRGAMELTRQELAAALERALDALTDPEQPRLPLAEPAPGIDVLEAQAALDALEDGMPGAAAQIISDALARARAAWVREAGAAFDAWCALQPDERPPFWDWLRKERRAA